MFQPVKISTFSLRNQRTNFSNISSSSGINSKDITEIFDEIGANDKKIAFTSSDGITELYAEIDRWDSTGEEAWVWVKFPTIQAAEHVTGYIYYDKNHADNTTYIGDITDTAAQNVWSSNFTSVYHLEEQGAAVEGEYKDSTSNAYHGRGGGGV